MKEYKHWDNGESVHQHCWHSYRGPILMVIKDGHVLEKCCECGAIRQVHIEHSSNKPLPWIGHFLKW